MFWCFIAYLFIATAKYCLHVNSIINQLNRLTIYDKHEHFVRVSFTDWSVRVSIKSTNFASTKHFRGASGKVDFVFCVIIVYCHIPLSGILEPCNNQNEYFFQKEDNHYGGIIVDPKSFSLYECVTHSSSIFFSSNFHRVNNLNNKLLTSKSAQLKIHLHREALVAPQGWGLTDFCWRRSHSGPWSKPCC